MSAERSRWLATLTKKKANSPICFNRLVVDPIELCTIAAVCHVSNNSQSHAYTNFWQEVSHIPYVAMVMQYGVCTILLSLQYEKLPLSVLL